MGVYTHSSGNWLSRRGTFLIILVVFHILLFWGLKSGFAVKLIEAVAPPIVADIINEVKPEEPPPPPPEVKMVEIPPVSVPPVLVDINIPEPPKTAIQVVTDRPPQPTPAPPPPKPVVRQAVVTKPGYSYKPSTDDYYPNTSRNLGEEGVVKVRLCYDLKGKVNESTLAETSNFSRLDDAAVRMGKQFRIKPGTVDGKPAEDCVVVPIRFSLKGESSE